MTCTFIDDDLITLISDYINEINIKSTRVIAYTKDIYGIADNDSYQLICDLNYLLYFLIMLNNERQNDILNGVVEDSDYYKDLYDIPCVLKYFRCRDIDVSGIINTVLEY